MLQGGDYMTFILFIISTVLIFLAHGIDKFSMSKYVSEKNFSFITFVSKICTLFALQLLIFTLVQYLIMEVTDFNLCRYLFGFKYFPLFLILYVTLFCYRKYHTWTINNTLLYISNVRYSHQKPVQHLNELLFHSSAQLEILEKKLSLLKSFSPIPVALLVLNNLPQNFALSEDIKSFVFQNQLNIGLLAILGFYTYHIVSTFSAQKQLINNISKIKIELYLLDTKNQTTSTLNRKGNS